MILPLFYHLLYAYDQFVLIYFAVLNLIYLSLFAISFFASMDYAHQRRVSSSKNLLNSPMALPISILVPAHNEAAVIVESVRSFLSVHYRQFEVIVINDGSVDETLECLKKAFGLVRVDRADLGLIVTKKVRGYYASPLQPQLLVIDKANGGKADSLNAGINMSSYPLFCAVDADSVLETEALLRVVKPFMRDPLVVAVGGIVRIANGNRIRDGAVESVHLPSNPLALFQIAEYLRAFFAGRLGWSRVHCLLLISGAFGLFRKDVTLRCGGYRTDTVGEDMDLVVRMHKLLREEKRRYRMVFIPDPICWTEVPESIKILRSQRDRWQRGLTESLSKSIKMFFNPTYGVIGMIAVPYFVFFEMLGPMIELGGYLVVFLSFLLGVINTQFVFLFFTAAILFGVLLSIGAVLLEEFSFHRYPRVRDMAVLVVVSILENIGYRQLNTSWRCHGMIRLMRKERSWGTMARRGFRTALLLMGIFVGATALARADDSPDQARTLMNSGNLDQAITMFKSLLSATPDDLDLRSDFGRALAWDNDYLESESEYHIILSTQSTNREALLGLAQLRRYQGRLPEALALLDQALATHPQDRELLDEKAEVRKQLVEKDCDRPYRYTSHATFFHEGYSFTGPGNGVGVSFQDRTFHGWNAGSAVSYEHRFALDDADLSANAAHELPWWHSYGGAEIGGATRGLLLPTAHASLFGGLPLRYGLSAESEFSFRHYSNANLYTWAPVLSWEGYGWLLSGAYTLSDSLYTDGATSHGLASYSTKLGYGGWCRLKPWVGYAHTKEAFEEGLSGAQNFRADHYSVGADLWLIHGWTLNSAYAYETRPDLVQHVNRFDVGLSYSWGTPVPPRGKK